MSFHATRAVAAMLLIFAVPLAMAAQDFSAYGFRTTVAELEELLTFQRSARLDPAAKVLADWSTRLQKLQVRELERSENRYAYAVDPVRNRQIIAIRGTANLVNALLDVETWKVESPTLGIRLHRGFETAASIVFKDVEQFLVRDMPIVVCGHSLGAAEAIIVGMFLTTAGYKVDKIVASGPPKVTDAEGWKAFRDLPVLRISAAFDPVPFLPPSNLYAKAPFTQGGPLLMLLDGPYFTIIPSTFYDAISPAFKEVKKASAHFDVVDHRVWTYCERIAAKHDALIAVPFAKWENFAKPRR
ncbi:MAG: lipase family protein [Spirochaetes bacterium]|nr:lipase family protein [Spirochaetota bacterium]